MLNRMHIPGLKCFLVVVCTLRGITEKQRNILYRMDARNDSLERECCNFLQKTCRHGKCTPIVLRDSPVYPSAWISPPMPFDAPKPALPVLRCTKGRHVWANFDQRSAVFLVHVVDGERPFKRQRHPNAWTSSQCSATMFKIQENRACVAIGMVFICMSLPLRLCGCLCFWSGVYMSILRFFSYISVHTFAHAVSAKRGGHYNCVHAHVHT